MTFEIFQPGEVDPKLHRETVIQEIYALLKRYELLKSLTANGRQRMDLRGGVEPDEAIIAEMKRQLVPGIDYPNDGSVLDLSRWPIRAGVRLEILAFSPWLKDVPGLHRLPKTEEEFVAYYERSIGKTRYEYEYENGTTVTEDLFEQVFGFSLAGLYHQIAYLEPDREEPKPAYLMLMSRHFRSAAMMEPKLLSKFMHQTTIDAFMLLAELQRAADLITEMAQCDSVQNQDMRSSAASVDNDLVLNQACRNISLQRLIDYAPLWNATVALALTVSEDRDEYLKVDGYALRASYPTRAEAQKAAHEKAEQRQQKRQGTKRGEVVLDEEKIRTSAIAPEEAFSFFSISRKYLPYAAVEMIAKAWNESKASRSSSNQSSRAKVAFAMQSRLDEGSTLKLTARVTSHVGGAENDFDEHANWNLSAFRERQRTAAASGRIQLPPFDIHGGSINFSHHYWWHRYRDVGFWSSFMTRNLEAVPLEKAERKDLSEALARVENFVKDRYAASESEQEVMLRAVADYATSLGAIATDPGWSNRLVSMKLTLTYDEQEQVKLKASKAKSKAKSKSKAAKETKPRGLRDHQQFDRIYDAFTKLRGRRSVGLQFKRQWDKKLKSGKFADLRSRDPRDGAD